MGLSCFYIVSHVKMADSRITRIIEEKKKAVKHEGISIESVSMSFFFFSPSLIN